MKIGVAQINSTVGDLEGNAQRILSSYQELVAEGAELVVTPELALTGYPPRDLLFAGEFVDRNLAELAELEKKIGGVPLVVGFVDHNMTGGGRPFYNAAAVLVQGEKRSVAYKRLIPNYDVFDEARYFEPGATSFIIPVNGCNIGITICEDLWTSQYLPRHLYSIDPPAELIEAGAELIINLSASPFQLGKPARRLTMVCAQAKRLNVPIVYCNAVGGNDQLIFDGHSLVVDAGGSSWMELPNCCEKNSVVTIANKYEASENLSPQSTEAAIGFVTSALSCSAVVEAGSLSAERSAILKVETSTFNLNYREVISTPSLSCLPSASAKVKGVSALQGDEMEELYEALVLGVRDYFLKCGFKNAILGLSGGIDSALVAALAVTALGSEAVTGILMPGPYSSQGSIDDAIALAKNLSIATKTISITPLYETMIDSLKPIFLGSTVDATEENIQARLRGVTLMALSNKWGSLLLTTGNKSELAVGYCTLYGDMCGGLAVISDLPKTIVYQLARWMNRAQEVIPRGSIEKPPSAELRPDQKDQDTLPPYQILDSILQLYIEENFTVAQILARGFEEATVRWIINSVDRNEYKRQQAAPGLKVTGRAFGVGRRLPIAQKYKT